MYVYISTPPESTSRRRFEVGNIRCSLYADNNVYSSFRRPNRTRVHYTIVYVIIYDMGNGSKTQNFTVIKRARDVFARCRADICRISRKRLCARQVYDL